MRPIPWFRTIPLRVRSIFCRAQVERELAEEFQYHLDMKIEELIAAGTPPAEARYAALRAMEGLEQHKEECRDTRGVRWLDEFRQDLRYALRILAKSPVALGLAIGLPCSMALPRLVSCRMHGLSPLHAAVYAIVVVLSFAVSLFAVALPARRVSANLINALRCE